MEGQKDLLQENQQLQIAVKKLNGKVTSLKNQVAQYADVCADYDAENEQLKAVLQNTLSENNELKQKQEVEVLEDNKKGDKKNDNKKSKA